MVVGIIWTLSLTRRSTLLPRICTDVELGHKSVRVGGGLTSCEEEKRSRPAGDVWLTARMATIHATNNNFMFRFKILLRCVFVSQPFETELEEIFSIIDNCLPDTFNHNSNAECQGHKMTFWATTPPFKLKRCLTFYRSR